MNIRESVKTYFSRKLKNEKGELAPKGVCPNCWGKQEWEGEFYTLNKGNKLVGYDQTYNSFINKIVEKNVSGISINEDTYKCETCEISYT